MKKPHLQSEQAKLYTRLERYVFVAVFVLLLLFAVQHIGSQGKFFGLPQNLVQSSTVALPSLLPQDNQNMRPALPGETRDDQGNTEGITFNTALKVKIPAFISWFIGVIAAAGILTTMFAGITILTSQGDKKKVDSAITMIRFAIFGLLLAIFSQVIVLIATSITL